MQKRSFRNGRLSEQVLHEMQLLIAESYAAPGSRLPKEAELADQFQVSRIVIREAMKILEDRGVVEVRAGRGSFTVAPKPDRVKESLLWLFRDQPLPTLQDMEALLELRQVLEETSASLAAVRASEEDLREIEDALKEMAADPGRDNGDLEGAIAADLRFHRAVMRAAHNTYLEMVLDPVMSVFLQQIKLTNSLETGFELHKHIFEQIRDRNAVGARQAVRRLMRRTLEDSRRTLKNFR
ncbi:MAG TPA: FadR/GntR family transcriptional regulator [Bryobacteraceae bacterium]|jgi:DNA-binding FadR family transcriptional regulator|nr:FadR/GntR family transcriptional regulator [Bryobacteraceae bacterium]